MRPAQNAMAIVATFFAAGAILPWSSTYRLVCAFVAIALILTLLVMRMRQHTGVRKRADLSSTQERIARIREARDDRFGR